MEEPFDELMGRPPKTQKKKFGTKKAAGSSSLITPEPSPTFAMRNASRPPSNAFSSRSSAPPTTAFSSHTTDRWSQYEKDEDGLRKESEQATGRAVASAAERAAYREDLASAGVEVALRNAGTSLPHPDEIKGNTGRFSSSSNKRISRRTSSDDLDVSEEQDRVRAEAMKVLEMAATPEPKKRVPSKLAGIDFTRASSRASQNSNSERSWAINDMNSDDEEDLVDIVQMKGPVSRQSSTTEESSTRSWSSRYSVDHRVVALSAARDIVEDLDNQEQERVDTSARNLLRVSPQRSKQTKVQQTKVFGSGFSFQAKNFFSNNKESLDPRNINLKTIWMDVDLQSNGKSLPSPPDSTKHRGPKTMERRRKLIVSMGFVILFVSILATVLGHHHVKKGIDPDQSQLEAIIDENAVKFYVIADAPYDSTEEDNIIRDLETIPGDSDFLIHLGNIQDAAVTLCPQQAYISAQAILRTSPIPVFVLPGPNDWNNCPDPGIALNDWTHQLGKFERFFVHRFGITHQMTNEENFAFVHKGVLFIGLHLVGGRKHDKKEWRLRHQKNTRWVEDQLENVQEDKYRAVILLANARPGQQHNDFFQEIFDDIDELGKPVLYIHASGGNGKFETYSPFPDDSKLKAVQVQSGGSNPPLRVAVGEGENPFVFST